MADCSSLLHPPQPKLQGEELWHACKLCSAVFVAKPDLHDSFSESGAEMLTACANKGQYSPQNFFFVTDSMLLLLNQVDLDLVKMQLMFLICIFM